MGSRITSGTIDKIEGGMKSRGIDIQKPHINERRIDANEARPAVNGKKRKKRIKYSYFALILAYSKKM